MDSRTLGLVGGVVGGVIGVLGGAIGTYCSIGNARGARERAFVIRSSAACVAGVSSFLALLWFVPFPYRAFLWLPYPFLLTAAILAWNRARGRIRLEAAGDAPGADAPVGRP